MNRELVLPLLALLLCSLSDRGLLAAESSKPNVLVIVADDLGYHDLGVQGGQQIPTPHIDSLALHGIRCTSGYVSGPYCSPTRAGLLTGRYQTRFGHEFNPGPPNENNRQVGLSLQEKTFADRFRAAGYVTGMVGKWHLGHAEQFHPLSRGFEEYFGFLGGAHPYFPAGKGGNGDNAVLRGRTAIDEREYLTDAFAREATAFIGRHSKDPFFLYLTFNAVHTPLQAPEKYLQRFSRITDDKRRNYAAMLSAMDDAVGAVLAKLRDAQVEQRTLIFFISDNGGPTQANTAINKPLRGFKATTWEGGVRVPWFVQWKERLPAGKTYDQPVIQLDILPTALAAAGISASDAKFDGVNLLPFLEGQNKSAPHDALYWRFGNQRAIRQGDWKLVAAREQRGANDDLPVHLFNLKEDIGETTDLSEKHPEKRKELEAAWKAWNAEQAPPTWGAQNRAAGTKAKPKAKNKNKAKAATSEPTLTKPNDVPGDG